MGQISIGERKKTFFQFSVSIEVSVVFRTDFTLALEHSIFKF